MHDKAVARATRPLKYICASSKYKYKAALKLFAALPDVVWLVNIVYCVPSGEIHPGHSCSDLENKSLRIFSFGIFGGGFLWWIGSPRYSIAKPADTKMWLQKLNLVKRKGQSGCGCGRQQKRLARPNSIELLGVEVVEGVCNKNERVAMPGGAGGTICHQTCASVHSVHCTPCAHIAHLAHCSLNIADIAH